MLFENEVIVFDKEEGYGYYGCHHVEIELFLSCRIHGHILLLILQTFGIYEPLQSHIDRSMFDNYHMSRNRQFCILKKSIEWLSDTLTADHH